MKRQRSAAGILPLAEISPTVDLADCWKLDGSHLFEYCNPAHHLILLESGSIRGLPLTGEFEARAGDLICFRPAKVNRYFVREPMVFYQAYIQFARPPRHRWTPALGELGPWPVRLALGKRFAAVRQVFETLCMEVSGSEAVPQVRVCAAVWELVTLVTEAMAEQPAAPRRLDDWDRLRLRLGESLRENPSVTKLAREMGLSPSHFMRQFKHRFGLSAKAYLTHVRLREAVRLLRNTDLSVKSVAFEAGFRSVQSFERLFKHHIGLRPLESRSQPVFAFSQVSGATPRPFRINEHNLAPHIAALGPDWRKLITTSSRRQIARRHR